MKKIQRFIVLAVFFSLSNLYGAENQRSPIDINLIIDGSSAFDGVREEVTAWVIARLDQILVEGDRVTVWNAGAAARVAYTGRMSGDADREALRKAIRELPASGDSVDYSGALRDAASRQPAGLCYTLLLCSTPNGLASVLQGPQANLLRFSRIEEFRNWRAVVVGLNLDARVRRATASFFE
jgi:hypothetical protein